MLERLNSFWIGNRFSYMEKLAVASALAVGHPFTVYSYTHQDLVGVPAGAELRDADEIMPREKFSRYFENGFYALASDFFRYALLKKNKGYWVDLDCYFLKALDFSNPYVFGWENDYSINGAVLRLPPDCEMIEELAQHPLVNWRPPFFGPKRTIKFYWQWLQKGEVNAEDLPWGSYGPLLITYLAKKYGVAKAAQPLEVFYPVSYENARELFGPADAISSKLGSMTRVVHMWHSRLGDLAKRPPPVGSFLDIACRSHRIDF